MPVEQPMELTYPMELLFTVDKYEDAGDEARFRPTWKPEGTPANFTVVPELPGGLTIDEHNGCIIGCPEEYEGEDVMQKLVQKCTVTATNTGGVDSKEIELTVQHYPPAELKYETPLNLIVGTEMEPAVGTITRDDEGDAVVVYTLVDGGLVEGALPDGLSFDEKTGTISGTPKIPVPAAKMTIKAANSGGEVSATFDVVILDAGPKELTYPMELLFTVDKYEDDGDEARFRPTWKPEGTPANFTVVPELPGGLTIDEHNGCIIGCPEEYEGEDVMQKLVQKCTVTATNTGGVDLKEIELTVQHYPPAELKYETP